MRQLNLAPRSATSLARHWNRQKRRKRGSLTVMSAMPTMMLRPAHLDAALVGFPSQAVSISGLPKSSGVYCPVKPIGFQGLGNHQRTSKQLQPARKMAMQVNMAKFPNVNYSTIVRMALQSTDRFRESIPKTATFPVIWDSGASI